MITMRSRSKAWGLMQNHEIMRTDFKIPLHYEMCLLNLLLYYNNFVNGVISLQSGKL